MFSFLAPLWAFLMIPFQDYMDFKGQVDAERLYQVIIVVPSVRSVAGRPALTTLPPSLYSPAFPPAASPPPPPPPPQVIGFVHGYLLQSFETTFAYWAVGSLLAAVLCIPSWPWLWHRDPVVWADDEQASSVEEKRVATAAAASKKAK